MPAKIAASGDRLGLKLFANGVLFGLQPDAIFAIVPALTLPTRLAAAAYIGMFVFGTVAAMGSYTAIIGEHPPSLRACAVPLVHACIHKLLATRFAAFVQLRRRDSMATFMKFVADADVEAHLEVAHLELLFGPNITIPKCS